MRSNEDLAQELNQLREEGHKWATKDREQRDEIKALKIELEWWRKTFGPEEFAK